MTQVWERLFIGAIGDAEALAGSNPPGVATVIALCRKPVRAKAEGINYLWFPLAEARPVPVGTLDAIIDALWENIRWGTVLLVSHDGRARAPDYCGRLDACRRLQEDIDAALKEVGKLRTVEPSPVLLRSVKRALQ